MKGKRNGMPCYKPLQAYRSKEGRNKITGKWPLVFDPNKGYMDMPIMLPCGQCIGCRLERSRKWAIRCVHEASMYDRNCFITLTYDDAHINAAGTLVKRDFQLFMKRLRKKYGSGIRYFHCGEYGSLNQRPHYHSCIFNFDFDDKVLWSVRNGVPLYRSKALEELWPYGFATVGEVTFESAAYVARYIMKKVTGDLAEEHYASVDIETGEIIKKQSEYVTMSRKPGIGYAWLKKYHSDVYPNDEVVIKANMKCKPPSYYDKIYDMMNPTVMDKVRTKRRLKACKKEYQGAFRLMQKEKCKSLQLKQLIRDL